MKMGKVRERLREAESKPFTPPLRESEKQPAAVAGQENETPPWHNDGKFPIITGVGLAEPLKPIVWLCEELNLMMDGRPIILSGYGGVGKTFAAQEMALAVAADMNQMWGLCDVSVRNDEDPPRVLHIDYEQQRRATQWRYQRLAYGLGIDLKDLGGRIALSSMPSVNLVMKKTLFEHVKNIVKRIFRHDYEPGSEERLKHYCQGYRLCIIDNLTAACPGINQNSPEMAEPLYMLGRITKETGCQFVVIHHENKPSKDSSSQAAYRMRGSGGIHGAVSSVISFSLAAKGLIKIESGKSNDGPEPDDHYVSFVDIGKVDPNTKKTEGLRIKSIEAKEALELIEKEKTDEKSGKPSTGKPGSKGTAGSESTNGGWG
jgi:AAA domain